ncbi:Ger(x)C family spore germination protein [Paenibacillus arenilitoris]|uniref:Ger(X)C family spore germination protein n=1 Tax=Paenibacillus arenilitoris TaxID=2772299 RepID=A0A927H5A4_9BACL|nr:Ger(x)C family spore germination protein [Paenibacillus arenilitoris]MBD2867349.1 Ger(x)C family spore germination protein [Paenibacillus arenilitoris]
MRKYCAWLGLLTVGAAVLLAGCWDRRELNDLAIAVGMGLDRQGGQTQVTVQIVNPGEVASKKDGGGYSPPVTTLKVAESTTIEALRKLTVVAPRKVYMSHLRILVIGEGLARQGILKVMDGISRNHELRSDFYIVVAKGTTAGQVMKILTPIDKIPANKMFSTLEMSDKLWAATVSMQLDKFISDLSNPTKDTVLTGIVITGNGKSGQSKKNMSRISPYVNLAYSGVALFKEDKLVDWLNEEEAKGYNYIMGNVNNSAGHIACPGGGTAALDITRSESKVKGKVARGQPSIHIDLFVEQNIGEVRCEVDLMKEANIQALEEIAEEKLTQMMKAAIRKAKKNKADIFGFGEKIEDADPKSWRKLKKDWDDYFSRLDVSIQVNAKFRRMGTTSNSLLDREE